MTTKKEQKQVAHSAEPQASAGRKSRTAGKHVPSRNAAAGTWNFPFDVLRFDAHNLEWLVCQLRKGCYNRVSHQHRNMCGPICGARM
jgi:hypothetical protein